VDTARWLRRIADDAVTAVAMEVSSHALHQGRVAAARFDAAIFTNLSRDHLDYHHTLDAYRASKLRLLELLKPGAAAIVNAEDPAWAHVGAEQVVRFGGMGDVRAENLRAGAGGMEATLVVPDGRAALRIPLFGSYNVANTLAAAAALWTLGWTAEEIGAGLGTLPQVPGRLERVPGPAGVPAVLLDYAHTPDALERALAALRPLVRGELVVVFGAGGDRDPGKRTEMGRVAAAGADRVIVTSDNPRTEDPNAIADAIESGMGDAPRLRLLDRREAIRRAILDAGADDVVLLAGKGHETYQIWGTEKLPFDERVIVRALFAEIQGLS
jgi:UDP-N-acetylmuramoyl-L-alanyl-D-glutamate--2,6-diaminopimelate ligase